MRRRDFVIALGSGIGASIAGYFSYTHLSSVPAPNDVSDSSLTQHRPSLKANITFGHRDGQVTISRGDSEDQVLCAVNRLGAAVLDKLNGRFTIEQIAASLSEIVESPVNRPFDAKVALFVAQLAMHGFLVEAFHVTIYENVEN